MNPLKLTLENFCGHEKSEISFNDFQVALVVGKIKNDLKFSNGSGKSTLFGAIKYVLFNETDFSVLEKIIRNGTDGAKVSFEFESSLDNNTYKVVRSLSRKVGSELRLYKKSGDAWDDLTSRRNSDTEKDLEKILKINYKTFSNSVLFSQFDFSGLASLTPAKRKAILKETLQLNVYSKYESSAKKKAGDLLKEVEKAKIILSTMGDPEKDIQQYNENLLELNNNFKTKHSLIEVKKNFLQDEVNKNTSLIKKFEDAERAVSHHNEKKKVIAQEIEKLIGSINHYGKKTTEIETSGFALASDIKKLEKSIEELSLKVYRKKEDIVKEIEQSNKDLVNCKTEIGLTQERLKDLYIPIPTGGTCKSCRQSIVNDIEECKVKIDKEIKEKEDFIKSAKEKISTIEKFIISLNAEIKLIEAKDLHISNTTQSLSAKTKEIEIKRSVYNEFAELLDKSKKELEIKQNEALKIPEFNIEEYSNLKLEINKNISYINSLKLEISGLDKETTFISNNIAIISSKIETRILDIDKIKVNKSNISELDTKYNIHQKVIQAFGSAGIPALITHTILDDFQLESNNWLAKLRPGIQLQFSVVKDRVDGDKDDTLEISYILDGEEFEYNQLSGAQKIVVSLGLKLGLATVINKRLGTEVKLLLIDEVDSSIDEGNLESFENAIKELQKYFKILVITHNKDLKEKFNTAIVVEQDERKISTAKVVNTW